MRRIFDQQARKTSRHQADDHKLRDADTLLNTGKDLASLLQILEVSESTSPSSVGGIRRVHELRRSETSQTFGEQEQATERV